MKKSLRIFMTGLLAMAIAFAFGMSAKAAHPARLVDNADLIFDYEEEQIIRILDEKSQKLNFDIVVVTTNSTDGKSSMAYADDFFDYNGYGMGDNYDGALLLVNMGNREWYISTTGYGIEALSDNDIEEIGEEVASYLSYGAYAAAFENFADLVEEEVNDERDAESLDVGEILIRLVIALVAGAGLAFIPVTVMKKKLDNVDAKKEASDYIRRDKIVMTEQRDMFLYRNIHRRAKPKDSGSRSGGSSVHRGSSGRSHGGGGGRF